MLHCDQKRIVNTRVLNVTKEASKEGAHNVQVAEVAHQVTLFGKIMEVAGQLYYLGQVVVAVLLISRILDAIDKRDEVLIGDGKLVEKPIDLEQSETEMNQHAVTKLLTVLEYVEVPLFEVIHDFQDGGPLSLRDVYYLPQSFFIFLKLILIDFAFFSMELLQKVV